MVVLWVVVMVAATLVAGGSSTGVGRCPRHEYMQDFNVSRFTGQWYEVERTFSLIELTTGCNIISLAENPRGHLDVVIRTESRWSNSAKEIKGTAVMTRKHPTILLYRQNSILPNFLSKLLPGNGFYQVLRTDYENYAIVWTCSNAKIAHTDSAWILGRKVDLDDKVRIEIYKYLQQIRIDTERLLIANNKCNIEDT